MFCFITFTCKDQLYDESLDHIISFLLRLMLEYSTRLAFFIIHKSHLIQTDIYLRYRQDSSKVLIVLSLIVHGNTHPMDHYGQKISRVLYKKLYQ